MARCLVFITALLCLPAFAQTTEVAALQGPPGPRQKIGLVLEGGGALGLAHVGVVEWLEANHVPVDYVAGTSMGALIGGMYSMGYSPKDIHQLVSEINWDAVLYDRIEYGDLAFRRKEDQRTYPNSLNFTFRKGLRLPEAFNAGHQVGLILDYVTKPYWDLKRFDDLPIPFRCVAVDMVTKKEDVFDRDHLFRDGSLRMALRASMSIPGIFTPVRDETTVREGDSERIEKKMYIDGGVQDNLPVQVARDMGAEVIIAVHLKTAPIDPAKELSVVDLAGEAAKVVTGAGENRSIASLKESDTLVAVKVDDIRSDEYEKYEVLISRGWQAAEANKEKLLAHRLDDAAWEQYKAQRASRIPADMVSPPSPQFVAISVDDHALRDQVRQGLSNYSGKPLDGAQTDRLERELDRIVGTGKFARVGYHLSKEGGKTGLTITATTRDYARATIKPVIEINGSDYRTPLFTLGARFTAFDLGGIGSEWRSDVLLGSQYGLATEYYRPLAPSSHWFVAPQITAESSPFTIYRRQDELAHYQLRTISGTLDVGYIFSRNAELRVGYEGGGAKLSQIIGAPLLPFTSDRIGSTSVKFSLDRLNFSLRMLEAPVIPRNGLEWVSRFQWHDAWLGSSHHFATAESEIGVFKSVGESRSVYLKASGGSTLGFINNGLPSFSLGGAERMAAYGINEFLTNQYAYGRAGYLHRIYAIPSWPGGGFYLTATVEAGKPYGIPAAPTVAIDGVAGVILDYAFGPLFLGGSWGESGHRKFFFHLGKQF
jgi:NTE family protein